MAPSTTIFTDSDRAQLAEAGISETDAHEQLRRLREGVAPMALDRPCTLGDGIVQLQADEVANFARLYEDKVQTQGIAGKFVPASGAATRMFAALSAYLEELKKRPDVPLGTEAERFFTNLSKFPFTVASNESDATSAAGQQAILENLLGTGRQNYSALPKALIPFHRYPDGARSALEEHIAEAAAYTCDASGFSRIHFTVAPDWAKAFHAAVAAALKKRGVDPSYWEIQYSEQSDATQTLAIDESGEPFRDDAGKLLFRPGGHGSLLKNLNELNWEMAFLKNIDNVLPESRQETHLLYKKALGGLLWACREQIRALLKQVADEPAETWWPDALKLAEQLGAPLPKSIPDDVSREHFVHGWFRRPMRVCGMVPNVGEPGGGPFSVKRADGATTPQIVESAEIDQKNPEQAAILKRATHFNPVDLVCLLTDVDGMKLDLRQFVNPDAVFISNKTYRGRPLKALEWPGLWNGAMANWFTLFVEVPIETFNPVKTVNDLLRPEHQS